MTALMLCDEVLSRDSYEEKKKLMSPDIFYANYQQEPIDLKVNYIRHLKHI